MRLLHLLHTQKQLGHFCKGKVPKQEMPRPVPRNVHTEQVALYDCPTTHSIQNVVTVEPAGAVPLAPIPSRSVSATFSFTSHITSFSKTLGSARIRLFMGSFAYKAKCLPCLGRP